MHSSGIPTAASLVAIVCVRRGQRRAPSLVAGAAELAAAQAAAVARGLRAAAQKANVFLLREQLPCAPPHTQGAHAHRTN